MFVCEQCHKGENFTRCWVCAIGPGSYGRCEVCGETKGCTDCHSYGPPTAAPVSGVAARAKGDGQ